MDSPSTMPQFACPGCQTVYAWKPQAANRKILCKCGTVFRAPAAAGEAATFLEVRQPPKLKPGTGRPALTKPPPRRDPEKDVPPLHVGDALDTDRTEPSSKLDNDALTVDSGTTTNPPPADELTTDEIPMAVEEDIPFAEEEIPVAEEEIPVAEDAVEVIDSDVVDGNALADDAPANDGLSLAVEDDELSIPLVADDEPAPKLAQPAPTAKPAAMIGSPQVIQPPSKPSSAVKSPLQDSIEEDKGGYDLDLPQEQDVKPVTQPGASSASATAPASGGGGAGRCPSCGLSIKAGAVLCLNCGFNIAQGSKIQTKVDKEQPAAAKEEKKGATAPPKPGTMAARIAAAEEKARKKAEQGEDKNWKVMEIYVPIGVVLAGLFLILLDMFVLGPARFSTMNPNGSQADQDAAAAAKLAASFATAPPGGGGPPMPPAATPAPPGVTPANPTAKPPAGGVVDEDDEYDGTVGPSGPSSTTSGSAGPGMTGTGAAATPGTGGMGGMPVPARAGGAGRTTTTKFYDFITEYDGFSPLLPLFKAVLFTIIKFPLLFVAVFVVAKLFDTSFGAIIPALLKLAAIAVLTSGLGLCTDDVLEIVTGGFGGMGGYVKFAVNYGAFFGLCTWLLEADGMETSALYFCADFFPGIIAVFLFLAWLA